MPPLKTPDGRYIVVRGRLWRTSNPHLDEAQRAALVHALSAARREVKAALAQEDAPRLAAARAAVHQAKLGLGERGAPWWTDGAPDFNRFLAKNTPYAQWYAQSGEGPSAAGRCSARRRAAGAAGPSACRSGH
ncbi:hypothetical protein ACFQOZ_18805 [Comamonas endophytica]|uniref:hypothetical protein n=1 Tax=Comamonas endophytica TaxID=2949090 RepID=UPI00360A55A1